MGSRHFRSPSTTLPLGPADSPRIATVFLLLVCEAISIVGVKFHFPKKSSSLSPCIGRHKKALFFVGDSVCIECSNKHDRC